MGKMMLDGLAGKAEIRKAESLVVGETCKALTQGAFESPVFPQNLNFCIRSTPTAVFFFNAVFVVYSSDGQTGT